MSFTVDIQKKLNDALPCVEFNEIRIQFEMGKTIMNLLFDDVVVATKRGPRLCSGDEIRLSGFTGRIETNLEFKDEAMKIDGVAFKD